MIDSPALAPALNLDLLPAPLIALNEKGTIVNVNKAARIAFDGIENWVGLSIELMVRRRVEGRRAHLWNRLHHMREGTSNTRNRFLVLREDIIPVALTFTRTQDGFYCYPVASDTRSLAGLSTAMQRCEKTLGVMELLYEDGVIKTGFFTESFFKVLSAAPTPHANGDTIFASLVEQASPADRLKITQFWEKPETFTTLYIGYPDLLGNKKMVKLYLIKDSYDSQHALAFLLLSEDGFQKAIEEKLLATHTAQSFHDINQPLYQLYLTLEEFKDSLAKHDCSPDAQQKLTVKELELKAKAFLRDVEALYHSAAFISSKVTDSFQISQGRIQQKMSRINLRTLFEGLNHAFTLHAQAENVTFKMNLNMDCEEDVLADEGKIRRIVSNLVSNAIKFTASCRKENDGMVILTVEARPHQTLAGKNLMTVTVEDNGPGIPDEKKAILFSPGIQLQNSVEGSGLGLSIIKSFVKAMDGGIRITRSEMGQGTTFVLEVPVVSTIGSPPIAQKKKVDESRHRGLRVLIADDNEVNLRLLEVLLKRMGYVVTKARDGREATDILEKSLEPGEKPFDFAIFDKEMKRGNSEHLDGDEAVKLWREKERSRGREEHLPIFGLTGSNTAQADKLLLEAGMDVVMHKVSGGDKKSRIYEIVQEHVLNKKNTLRKEWK